MRAGLSRRCTTVAKGVITESIRLIMVIRWVQALVIAPPTAGIPMKMGTPATMVAAFPEN
jgi:hypothetical protein